MQEPAFTIEDLGTRAVPEPVMARHRHADAHNRLVAANSALASAQAALRRSAQAIWAANLTMGLNDLAAIEGHAEAAIGCLAEVKRLAAEARARVQAEGVSA